MNTRGYFDAESEYRVGSEYVKSLVTSHTANIIMSSLNQGHAMMQQAVTSDGTIRDETALEDVRACIDIAQRHLNVLFNQRGPIPGTRVLWPSGHETPMYGTIVRTFNTHMGVTKFVVIEDESQEAYTLIQDDFRIVA